MLSWLKQIWRGFCSLCVCVCVEILEVEAASELDNSWFLLLCLLCVYPLPLLTRTQVFENG